MGTSRSLIAVPRIMPLMRISDRGLLGLLESSTFKVVDSSFEELVVLAVAPFPGG